MEDENLISQKKQTDKIIEEINKKHNKISQIKENCDLLFKEIQSSTNNNKKIESSLSKIKSTSEQIFDDLNKKKNEINVQFINVNNFFEKRYLPLIKKIDNPENGFAIKIEKTNSYYKEIEKTSNSVSKLYEEIKKHVTEYRRIAQSLKSLETSTQKIFDFISDKKPKIEEIFKNISETEKNVKSSYTEIKRLLTESKKDNESITSLKELSSNDYSEILSKKDESDKLLTRIQEIYEIAAETGLSGEFENRRNNLKIEVGKWEKRLLIVTLTLLGCLFGLFIFQLYLYNWDIKGHNFDLNFYVRFLILSPIVYYLIFCSTQHDKVKKLHDKYSFKTTLAMSIKSHIELLLSNKHFQTQERIDSILEFIISGFNKIYKEPYSDEDYKLKLKLANIELDIENRILEKLTKENKKE
jgi:hypothetical protein